MKNILFKLIFIALSCFLCSPTYSQKVLDEKMKSDSIEGMRLLLSTIELRANWQLEAAIQNAEIAKNMFEGLYGSEHLLVADSWNQLGLAFYKYDDYFKAEAAFRQSYTIRVRLYGENHYLAVALLNNLGLIYWRQGNFNRAIEHFLQIIAVNANVGVGQIANIINAQFNIAGIYINKKEYTNSIKFYKKAYQNLLYLDSLAQIEPNRFIQLHLGILNGMGQAYLGMDSIKLAVKYNQQALQFAKEKLPANDVLIGEVYIALSQCYAKLQDYKNSVNYAKSGIKTLQDRLPEKHINITIAQFTLVDALIVGKRYAQADSLINLVFSSLNYQGSSSLSKVSRLKELIQILEGAAKSYRINYAQTKQPKYLYQSRHYYREAIAALDYQFKSLPPNAVAGFSETAHNILSGAISTHYLLYKSTDSSYYKLEAFGYANRTKGILLQQAIQATNAQNYAGVSNEFLQEETQLRLAITLNDKKNAAFIHAGIPSTDARFIELYQEREKLNQRLDYFIEKMKEQYPRYYQARYNQTALSVKHIQDTLLSMGQTLLEFVVEDSSIYAFIVKKQGIEMTQIKRDFPLEKWVHELTSEGIYAHYNLKITNQKDSLKARGDSNYTRVAYQLFVKLIHPIQQYLGSNLIIIPDGILGYVPFEALLSEQPKKFRKFETYPYLVQKYQISYCYAISLLDEMKKKNSALVGSQTRIPFLGMAPFQAEIQYQYLEDDDLPIVKKDILDSLPESIREVEVLNRLWKGISYYEQEATKAQFETKSRTARIIHLSTHAFGNAEAGDYSFIAFRHPQLQNAYTKLFARDIYNLTLQADLITLSACETGYGELQNGEGIISLARAFAYAGAKSIVSSLWKVEDKAALGLMTSFYQYLMEGKHKDEALQLTKKDFLSTRKDSTAYQAHPFFWVGFICIGDTRPLK